MKHYDVIIIGAGPGGIFSAYELTRLCPGLKVAIFEAGAPLENRKCPIDGDKIKTCIHCKTCSIMNGFGGAGAFSDGKYNITNEFGGTLYEYIGRKQAIDLMNYVDKINVENGGGATKLYSTGNSRFKTICLKNNLHLLTASVRHLGTDINYDVLENIYADLKDGILVPTAQIAHDLAERSASEQAFLSGVKKMLVPEMTAEMTEMNALVQQRQKETLKSRRAANYDYNNFRGLLILIEYNDKSFSRSDYKELLTNMVNKEGYTGYDNQSYTGSVRDYFSDNSLGKFKPEFDVYGPYKVDYSQTDPKGTSGCRKIINAVLDAADADINYADYDRDGDGVVDMVFFIVPGCGANYSGNNSRYWWPHRSIIRSTSGEVVTKDGVAFEDYASSVEMYGWERRSRLLPPHLRSQRSISSPLSVSHCRMSNAIHLPVRGWLSTEKPGKSAHLCCSSI